MTRSSSNRARCLRPLIPLFWFGCIGAALLALFASGAAARAPFAVAVPVVMAGVGDVLVRLSPRRLTALPGRP